MWTTENRHRYDRDKLRYPSDLTDAEWSHIKPFIPPARRGGGLPLSTVNGYFCQWDWDGTLEKMHHALYVKCREQAEGEASPTACILDSQSVKSAEKGALPSTRMASMQAS
jgi:transposase